MAHFAKIENDIVTQVLVADQEFIDTLEGEWIQTSYNTRGGVHYGSDGNPDDGIALRANYAGIGYTYDREHDVFYAPQPYPSWILSKTKWEWQAPVEQPIDDIYIYTWNEETKSWVK